MEYLTALYGFIAHIDQHLLNLSLNYGAWIYLVLFIIIFCETGLVITPLLPGDSLLFAAGSVAALGGLNPHILAVLLIIAAILGDTVNYWIGYWLGPKVFHKQDSFFLKQAYLQRTHEFYQRHGGKTIIIARFVPIIRTFAPFVAGIGRMPYLRFMCFNVAGAIIWVCSLIYISYFFGNIPIIKDNFPVVILLIIIISLLPPLFEFARHKFLANANK